MENNNSFIIPFKGLNIGIHEFRWMVDTSFFEMFPASEIQEGLLNVVVALNKGSQFMKLDFQLQGQVKVPCDRCLDLVAVDTEYQAGMVVKFGASTLEETEDLLVLAYEEHQLDVAQYLYEYAHLSLPNRVVHEEDSEGHSQCNPKMLEKLKEYLVERCPEDGEEDDDDEMEFVNN